jgi:serine kinase of HPr protein (carbohydrate metabolism regulator)
MGAEIKIVSIHATLVAIGEAGVLVRGESGAGKSRLAQALLAEGRARGLFARLVADDRVRLSVAAGRVIGRAPPRIAGLIEERGTGLLVVAHESAANVRCIVDLERADASDGRPPRLPEAGDEADMLEGVSIPRIRLARDVGPMEGAPRVLNYLARVRSC